VLNLSAAFLMMVAAPDPMAAPSQLLGHYFQEGWTRVKDGICHERGEGRLFGMVVEPKMLRLGADSYRIIFSEQVANNETHLWVADARGDVSLLHLSQTEANRSIFVVFESAQARQLALDPTVIDAGVLGSFERC
jgi:hypothetical protein